ncbi:MAG: signal peptidase II [bacterium]
MKRKWIVLLCVSALSAALDQWTKMLVHSRIPLARHVPVVQGFFDLVHVRNRGGAFGLFAGMDASLRGPVFLVLSIAAIALVVGMIRKAPDDRWGLVTALSLVLGGAIGNLIDRIRLGEVIDFLDFYRGRYHWPAFNVADVAIVVGVGILMIDLVRHPDADDRSRALDGDAAPTPPRVPSDAS